MKFISNPKVPTTQTFLYTPFSNFLRVKGEDDYQPSAELLAALNGLPPELLDGRMGDSEEEEELRPRIKPEPVEHQIDGM